MLPEFAPQVKSPQDNSDGCRYFGTTMVIHASKDIPIGFAHQGAAPADQVIPLRIALKQTNIAGLEAKLYDVSTPGSANYGNHLSKEEV